MKRRTPRPCELRFVEEARNLFKTLAMARDDMAVLEQLGCSPEEKNIFGISPAMMMRFNPTPGEVGLRYRVVEVR